MADKSAVGGVLADLGALNPLRPAGGAGRRRGQTADLTAELLVLVQLKLISLFPVCLPGGKIPPLDFHVGPIEGEDVVDTARRENRGREK